MYFLKVRSNEAIRRIRVNKYPEEIEGGTDIHITLDFCALVVNEPTTLLADTCKGVRFSVLPTKTKKR